MAPLRATQTIGLLGQQGADVTPCSASHAPLHVAPPPTSMYGGSAAPLAPARRWLKPLRPSAAADARPSSVNGAAHVVPPQPPPYPTPASASATRSAQTSVKVAPALHSDTW